MKFKAFFFGKVTDEGFCGGLSVNSVQQKLPLSGELSAKLTEG